MSFPTEGRPTEGRPTEGRPTEGRPSRPESGRSHRMSRRTESRRSMPRPRGTTRSPSHPSPSYSRVERLRRADNEPTAAPSPGTVRWMHSVSSPVMRATVSIASVARRTWRTRSEPSDVSADAMFAVRAETAETHTSASDGTVASGPTSRSREQYATAIRVSDESDETWRISTSAWHEVSSRSRSRARRETHRRSGKSAAKSTSFSRLESMPTPFARLMVMSSDTSSSRASVRMRPSASRFDRAMTAPTHKLASLVLRLRESAASSDRAVTCASTETDGASRNEAIHAAADAEPETRSHTFGSHASAIFTSARIRRETEPRPYAAPSAPHSRTRSRAMCTTRSSGTASISKLLSFFFPFAAPLFLFFFLSASPSISRPPVPSFSFAFFFLPFFLLLFFFAFLLFCFFCFFAFLLLLFCFLYFFAFLLFVFTLICFFAFYCFRLLATFCCIL